MFCLNCDCVLIIWLCREGFYIRSTRLSLVYQEYRYIKDGYIGVLSHTFYCNFCQDIEYSSLYWEYHDIDDNSNGFHCTTMTVLWLDLTYTAACYPCWWWTWQYSRGWCHDLKSWRRWWHHLTSCRRRWQGSRHNLMSWRRWRHWSTNWPEHYFDKKT